MLGPQTVTWTVLDPQTVTWIFLEPHIVTWHRQTDRQTEILLTEIKVITDLFVMDCLELC